MNNSHVFDAKYREVVRLLTAAKAKYAHKTDILNKQLSDEDTRLHSKNTDQLQKLSKELSEDNKYLQEKYDADISTLRLKREKLQEEKLRGARERELKDSIDLPDRAKNLFEKVIQNRDLAEECLKSVKMQYNPPSATGKYDLNDDTQSFESLFDIMKELSAKANATGIDLKEATEELLKRRKRRRTILFASSAVVLLVAVTLIGSYEMQKVSERWKVEAAELQRKLAAERKEAELKEAKRKAAEQKEAELREAERRAAEKREAKRMGMVFVKGGCYEMGDTFGDGKPDEKPPQSVCVDDFYIGKYEVTQKQWLEVMDSNPSHFKDCNECPVEEVSMEQAQEFIRRLNQRVGGLNYRLPTEKEWEYAARSGGKKEKWAGTSKESELDEYAWYRGNMSEHGAERKTHPVGQKRPNGFGLYDMSGNVCEWVIGNDSNRQYFRGGSWLNYATDARTSARLWSIPPPPCYGCWIYYVEIGFRLAASSK